MSGLKKSKATVILIVFSMMISLLATSFVNAGTSLSEITEVKSDEYVEITRTVSKTQVLLNEEVTITYTIKPKDIPVVSQPVVKKEVMLVVDASSSMKNYNISPGKTRLKGAQNAAKSFISTLKDENDKHPGSIKVGMITFSSEAIVKNYGGKVLSDNFEMIKTDINNISTTQGTNIGDALRVAYYALQKGDPDAEKYIVLLSDGEASYFTGVKDDKGTLLIKDKSDKLEYFTWEGSSYQVETTNSKGKKETKKYTAYAVKAFDDYGYNGSKYWYEKNDYCYAMAEIIKDYNDSHTKKIKPLMIAYGNDADKAVLIETAKSAGGSESDVYDAQSAEALENVFTTIKDEIVKEYSLNNINFEEEIPEGFTLPVELGGFDINPPDISKTISTITYKLNDAKTLYTADPVIFQFTMKCVKAGTNIFGGATFTYDGITGSTKTINFSSYNINGHQNQAPITINRTITPADGIVDSAVISKYTISPGSFTVDPAPYDGVLPATLTVSGIELKEKLPDGLMLPATIPENFTVDAHNNITATLPPIVYTKNAANQYVASDIILELPIIPTKTGIYHWNGEIAYIDVDGLPKTKSYDGDASIKEYGTPTIEVVNVTKKGDKVDITVKYTLPSFTSNAKVKVDNLSDTLILNVATGYETFKELSIYETHTAKLTATSTTSVTRTIDLVIYEGIKIN